MVFLVFYLAAVRLFRCIIDNNMWMNLSIISRDESRISMILPGSCEVVTFHNRQQQRQVEHFRRLESFFT